MALTLDATLKTRMDTLNRRPIVEIMSLAAQESIPLFHTYFNTQQTQNEDRSALLIHSSGRLCFFYNLNNGEIYEYYTDTEQ